MTVLPFGADQFFALFAEYNRAIWPAQIAAYLLGATALAMALRGRGRSSRLVVAILGAMWMWTGVAYHLLYFKAISPAALGFGAAFVLQGGIFAWMALRGPDLDFGRPRRTARFAFGLFLVLYAAVLYPLLGHVVGHAWPAVPSFGVTPCPVAIFTFGLLLLARGRVPFWAVVVPALWAAIGGQAAFLLDVPQDWMLLVGGLGATAVLLRAAWRQRPGFESLARRGTGQ